MKVVLQRVKYASCTVDNKITGEITKGYLLLVGFTNGDDTSKIDKAVKKILGLRIFEDENNKMNLSLKQVEGKILSISQFTLYADTNCGNRPSFVNALNPLEANELYKIFNDKLREQGYTVEEGIFGAHMDIKLLNDGPCTIIYEF